jgi:hypothetical protein
MTIRDDKDCTTGEFFLEMILVGTNRGKEWTMPMLGTQKQLLLAIIATSDNMEETREDLERIMLSTIYIYIYI